MSTKSERFNSLKQLLTDTVNDHKWAYDHNEKTDFLHKAKVIFREDDLVVVRVVSSRWTQSDRVESVRVNYYTTTHWGEPINVKFSSREPEVRVSSGGHCSDASVLDIATLQREIWRDIEHITSIYSNMLLDNVVSLEDKNYKSLPDEYKTLEEKS